MMWQSQTTANVVRFVRITVLTFFSERAAWLTTDGYKNTATHVSVQIAAPHSNRLPLFVLLTFA
jgi:hypothetical protein